MSQTVCAVCRFVPVPPERSVCQTCVPGTPPDNGAARIAELEQALKRVACFAASSQDENSREWMEGLVGHLNQAAVTLNEPTQFVLHRENLTGHLWITAETIP